MISCIASRAYLGVHPVSDVVGGLLLGAVFLLGVEWVMHRTHGLTVAPPPAYDSSSSISVMGEVVKR